MATMKNFGEMPLKFPDVEAYFKRLHFYLVASDKSDLAKAVLLSSCGQEAFALIETLFSPTDVEDEEVDYASIKEHVLNHLRPRTILHYERHQLHSMTQGSDPITVFIQSLRDQANRCEFGDFRDDLILTQFIFGLKDREMRAKLLAKPELTLESAIQECLFAESLEKATNPSNVSVAAIKRKFNRAIDSRKSSLGSKHNSSGKYVCYSCGQSNHLRINCKYRNSKCRVCNGIGHLAAVCKSKSKLKIHNIVDGDRAKQNEVVMSVISQCSSKLIYLNLKIGSSYISYGFWQSSYHHFT